jgi:hypothetical protein
MTATPKLIVSPQTIPATQATAYTSPTSGRGTWIDAGQALNYAGGTEMFSLWLVPSGGAAGNDNIIQHDVGIAHKVAYAVPCGFFLPAGASLVWQAANASKINAFFTGRELSA